MIHKKSLLLHLNVPAYDNTHKVSEQLTSKMLKATAKAQKNTVFTKVNTVF